MNRVFLMVVTVFFLNISLFAGDGFYRKAKKHKEEFREIATYLISNNYHRNFVNAYLDIQVDTIQNIKLKNFCKKFRIKHLVIQGEYDYQGKTGKFLEDSVIVFGTKYVPVLGSRHEIIIDCTDEKKDWDNFEGYGQKQVRIEKGMYYFGH